MPQAPKIVDIQMAVIEGLLARTEVLLSAEDQVLVKGLIDSLVSLTKLVRERGTTIARLRRLFGLSGSEKTADVLGKNGSGSDPPGPGAAPGAASAGDTPVPAAPDAGASEAAGDADDSSDKKPKGHGRVPASDYPDAKHIPVPHESLRPGETCPACDRGTLYLLKEPAQFLRIIGQAPLTAVCWDCGRLRCSACGKVFTARAPEEAHGPKHTETAASMMVLLRYGSGMPLNRLDHLQRDLGTPVPASTQWAVALERSHLVRPVFDELGRQAAQGQLFHDDDTYVRILEFMGKRREKLIKNGELSDPDRTGLFTTAVVSITPGGKRIALFLTGRKHAGENLSDLLRERVAGLPPLILMSDALDRNVPKGHNVVWCNCLAHGRRHVVDEVENFPDECEYILDALGKVFKLDERCRKEGLLPDERLRLHQAESGPVMDDLEKWMTAQLTDKRVEPNSGMGEAINYMLKRWDKLTLFLRVPGAPIDNNVCERTLKMAIRHRNNSLFYKTQRGATVGDIWMSLIHTAEFHGQNPFHYLTVLQIHAKAVADRPADWLPWNYNDALARLGQLEDRVPVSAQVGPSGSTPARRATGRAPVAAPN
jgi:transposase